MRAKSEVTSGELVLEHFGEPVEEPVEIAPEAQTQFLTEAQETSIAEAEEHLSIVEAIRKSVEGREAALAEALHEVEVEEQNVTHPSSLAIPLANPPEAVSDEAQKTLDEAEKAARAKSEEKVWRSPLTYR